MNVNFHFDLDNSLFVKKKRSVFFQNMLDSETQPVSTDEDEITQEDAWTERFLQVSQETWQKCKYKKL